MHVCMYACTQELTLSCILREELDLSSAPWPHVSSEAKGLVRAMLNKDPMQRATIDQVRHARRAHSSSCFPFHLITLTYE
jgi:hypothetical protein